MKESKSISLFTLLFLSIFINSKRFLIIVLVSFIIIFIILFSSLYPKTNLNIGVVNLDKGLTLQFSSNSISFSDQIIENLKKQGNSVVLFKSLDNALNQLNNGNISLILYFPENYTLFTHLANFSKASSVKPRIYIYANEKKFSKEIKLELFTAFSEMVETKIIPLEIVETITNKQIPSNYILVSGLFIFIFLFSFFVSYNFGFYLLNKNYNDFLQVINQSFLPIIIILSILISLLLFILNSVSLTIYTVLTKKVPFFGYSYIPITAFLLSFSASILGYFIVYIYRRKNVFVLLAFIMFFIHYITYPFIDVNNIFTKIISYLFLSVQLEKIWYWVLSLNIQPTKGLLVSIYYSSFYLLIILIVFFLEFLIKNKRIQLYTFDKKN